MSDADRVRELEEQNAQLLQQLVKAQKMTALGELVSTTTHEFNNVLTTIINYAKLGMRHKDDATRDKALQKILSAGERAARITNSVLGMARNRRDQFEPVQLGELIAESRILLDREMSKYRVSVDCQLAEVPPVLANGNQIQQVLLNLMINARQAMPHGGTLMIRLLHDVGQQTVDLVIRDTGVGIPQQELPRIFDAFFTTKSGPDASGKGGTGLGLAACRTIIESHRGRIRVESSVGKGTAFTIKLPVAETRAVPVAAHATAAPEAIVSEPTA
jgi:signal transduction histidine kinase